MTACGSIDRMKLASLVLLSIFCAACGGGLPTIPLPSGGSITLTDGGVTVCTTVPRAAVLDAGY